MYRLRSSLRIFVVSLVILFMGWTVACSEKAPEYRMGVLGKVYNSHSFTRVKSLVEALEELETTWDNDNGHGMDWSAIWEGYLIGPVTGDVTIVLQTNKLAILEIDGFPPLETTGNTGHASARSVCTMEKGKYYKFQIKYIHTHGGSAYWNVRWAYDGGELSRIPSENLAYDAELAKAYNWFEEPDPESIDYKQFARTSVKHVMVSYEPGRTRMCPANNGSWIWGDEILFGMTRGYYKDKTFHHSYDRNKPMAIVFGRSLDGGETWTEEPFRVDSPSKEERLNPGIKFTHPDFTLVTWKDRYYVSYDRGKQWTGPYHWPNLVENEPTSRTDYLVDGDGECLFFMSAKEPRVEARLRDRAFCAVTKDGGKTAEFLSWITDEPIHTRSVMPSSVRLADTHLVSALRRRHDNQFHDKPPICENWIDVYESVDNGKTWRFLSKVAQTDNGKWNGNPPTLIRLDDGRLCVTYCFRGVPYSLRARLSEDDGKTWGKEILLREDARKWDIGYTRTQQRSDGKMVTVYYWTTETHKEPHLAATIWDPDTIEDVRR